MFFIERRLVAMMGLLLTSILSTLILLGVQSKDMVSIRGNIKFTLHEVQTNCDQDQVEYFHELHDQEKVYTFRVTRLTPSFNISITLRNVKSQSVLYKLKNLDGCLFLNNPIMARALNFAYRAMVYNGSFFHCPILPKVYFLRNMASADIIPTVHPAGHYILNVRIIAKQNPHPYVMELILRYSIVQLKNIK